METYEESWPRYVTLSQALRELKNHQANLKEFFEDCGVRQSYKANTVLHWLGY